MDYWTAPSITTSPSPRLALEGFSSVQRNSHSFNNSLSFAFAPSLSSSKRTRYDIATECRLAAEASTRVVAKVYEFSAYVQEGSTDEEEQYSMFHAPQIREQICTAENQLAAAILKREGGKYWVNICPPGPGPGTAHGTLPALTLEAALRVLQHHCGLQSYSVLDTLASTHRVKLDSDVDSLYCSSILFSLEASPTGGGSSSTAGNLPKLQESKSDRSRSPKWQTLLREPLLPTKAQGSPHKTTYPGQTSSQGYFSCSLGTLQELVHLGIPPGTLAGWKQPLTGGRRVNWQRACLFLTQNCVITVFREPQGAASVVSEIQKYFSMPEMHLMELSKGPSYIFYKVVEAVVLQLEGVLLGYRKALLACEEHTFKQGRLIQLRDRRQLRHLHLMQQELRVIRQQLVPADRLLTAMLESTTTDLPLTRANSGSMAALLQETGASVAAQRQVGGLASVLPPAAGEASRGQKPGEVLAGTIAGRGPARKLLNDETKDYLQEVKDDITARLMETDELIGACKELELLMNSMISQHTSVFLRLLTTVTVVCLPLTCLASIYGTNFAILPELAWGVTSSKPVQPDGYPLGYMFMLSLMGLLASGAVFLLRQLQVL